MPNLPSWIFILFVAGLCQSNLIDDYRRNYNRQRRSLVCMDKRLSFEQREDKAQVVVTGLVYRVYRHNNELHSCEINIVRVFKGDVIPWTKVFVDGLGNPEFCEKSLDTGDARIFLLESVDENRLKYQLTSSPIRISSKSLREAEYAVNDQPATDENSSSKPDLRKSSPIMNDGKEKTPVTTKVVPDKCLCKHGGTCIAGVYCLCPLGRTGPDCSEKLKFRVPAFNGVSYIAYPTISAAYLHFEITIEFRSESQKSGILLYNAQKATGYGDFFAVTLSNGRAQLRYNLGSGVLILTHPTFVKPFMWHVLKVGRRHSKGYIQLDDGLRAIGQSPGSLSGLNLQEDLFLGAIPEITNRVIQNTGVKAGFKGCVGKLVVNGKSYDLASESAMALYGSRVGQCDSTPCDSSPCLNGANCINVENDDFNCECDNRYGGPLCGELKDVCDPSPCFEMAHCEPIKSGGFRCVCPSGMSGDLCNVQMSDEQGDSLFMPFFNGHNYLSFAGFSAPDKLDIQLWMMVESPDGVLLYAGKKFNDSVKSADFFSLNLRDGFLEMRYDLGSGVAEIRSSDKMVMDSWYSVNISRIGKYSEMRVNEDFVNGSSPRSLSVLNTKSSILIGGVPEYASIDRRSRVTGNFVGAIQKLVINDKSFIGNDASYAWIKQHSDNKAEDVSPYSGHPCTDPAATPCNSNGACIPQLGNYTCTCHVNFLGETCNRRQQFPVRFDGKTVGRYDNVIDKTLRSAIVTNIELALITEQKDGIILWTGDRRHDYMAVSLFEGRPVWEYDLGSGKVIFKSTKVLNDEKWHKIKIHRHKQYGKFIIDDVEEKVKTPRSPGGSTHLDSDGLLYLGGHSDSKLKLQNYDGCLANVTIHTRRLLLEENLLNDIQLLPCA